MKKLLFLCFFGIHMLLPALRIQAQESLEELLAQAQRCSDEEISSYSQKLSGYNQSLQIRIENLQQTCEQKKQSLLEQQAELEQQKTSVEIIKKKNSFFVQGLQNGFFSLSGYFSCWQNYQSFIEQEQKQKHVDSLRKELLELEENLDALSSQQSQIEESQQQLARRYFQSHSLLEEGTKNEQSLILGSENLPDAGGIKNGAAMNLQACLAGAENTSLESSGSFLWPVQGGVISAGTWEYPGGGMHLGVDIAASLYSNVYAPGNGLILYADAPVDSNCGYLGNYSGYPYGAGNSIALLAYIDDQLYAITFAHLSNIHYVKAGQSVSQGDVIALSGNSGNSTGPHTHIEVFEIHVSLSEAVSYFASTADFAWGCGWSEGGTSSTMAARLRPELLF